jgi:hypothetical protein
MAVQEASVTRDDQAPTEAEPEIGAAMMCVGDHEIVLSEGARWIEPDGEHVIRSLEFDVIAGAPTFSDALSKFIDNIWDFVAYLAELEDLAENEMEMFHRLAPRLIRVSRELERVESRRKRPLVSVNLRRRRRSRKDVRGWHPSSRQRGSRLPSHA